MESILTSNSNPLGNTTSIINNNNINNNNNNNSNNPIIDCIKEGILSYIYLVEDNEFTKNNNVIPKPKKQWFQNNSFSFDSSNLDISQVKEIYEYIKFFEIQQTQDYHMNDNIKRYARFHLNLTLKFMGCKSIHARLISNAVFEQFERCREIMYSQKQSSSTETDTTSNLNNNSNSNNNSIIKDKRSIYCVSIQRSTFYYLIGHILTGYQYSKPQYIHDFPVASEVQEKKHSFTILLGGTSGCGKSTLTALLASRIGFTAVISTDNIRQLLRKFISRTESPILWASTYHAGEIISDPSLSHKDKILKGYEAQNEMIFNKLDVLIGQYEQRRESLIIEGVHLDTRVIVRLVEKHPTCIPFLMYISNEMKHKERFAIRSKYMTLDPHQNKYTKYFKNIRIINDYLCSGADEYMIPQIDNTSIDRSLATIHGTIFACLKRKANFGESYFSTKTNKFSMLYSEYEQIQHQFWSSKGMLRLIQKKRETPGVQSGADNSANPVDLPEENFNSDNEEEDEDKKSAPKLSSKDSGGQSNPNDDDDDSDTSDSNSEDTDRIDYYLDCGSLGS
ncbi:hypothetical protein DLAC_01767 [Tieghemostelium lacteum]|uniref:Uncharacterized protein n=1 Tax=Tieghemostelium lacteum TaxID=361077 RepID=A0A152A6Q6_TIELA|nr:hypothetical protein DLAC_01767 [Tieghemostelium lacteum]|eukprot:KYR01757.1 hypothetical protein DLAC_01767 [Tieghemostelium lacteum]